MRKHTHSNRGFTMMETLIVVGIVAVLLGLSFIAVMNYRRSMKQLELDETACEIFVAAQNHLTMAKSQGTLDARQNNASTLGISQTREGEDGKPITYHYFFYDPSAEGEQNPLRRGTVLFDMLPQFSLDDTVRSGGSYVIEYVLESATVTNVFYSDQSDMSNVQFSESDYEKLFVTNGGLTEEAKKDDRLAGLDGDPNKIIGWYGGDNAKGLARVKLYAPRVEVINEECLEIKVSFSTTALNKMTKNSGADAIMQLIITGKTSGKSRIVNMNVAGNALGEELNTFTVTSQSEVSGKTSRRYKTYILDDITQANGQGHFAKQWCTGTDPLIPGEDIEVKAVVLSNTVLANINESAPQTTNSLFKTATVAEAQPTDGSPRCKVEVANFRHMENLDKSISGFDRKSLQPTAAGAINVSQNSGSKIIGVTQTNDMVWIDNATSSTAFLNKIYANEMRKKGSESKPEEVKVWSLSGTDYKAGTYAPVNMTDAISYDGGNHSISNVKVEVNAPAGLFGGIQMSSSSSMFKDLELLNCSAASTMSDGYAGSLLGYAIGSIKLSNILVHDSVGTSSPSRITSKGASGGLVGMLVCLPGYSATVDGCAAAVYVESRGEHSEAGGLVGYAQVMEANTSTPGKISITNSYAGGHTTDGAYDATNMNVVSDGSAGGLVGKSLLATIDHCYATTSAQSSSAAGGLVGQIAGGSVSKCYAVGRVDCTDKNSMGGVVGILQRSTSSSTAFADNYWLKDNSGEAIGNYSDAEGFSVITDSFLPAEAARANAVPYDSVVSEQYKDKYQYRTILQLYAEGDTNKPAETKITNTHYGDWGVSIQANQLEIIDVNEENHFLIVVDNDYTVSESDAKKYGTSGLVRLTYTSVDASGAAKEYTRELHPEAAGNATLSVDGTNRTANRTNNTRDTAGYVDCGFETSQFCKAETVPYTEENGEQKYRRYYYVLIDSITAENMYNQNGHASDRFPGFAPGANIAISAKVVGSSAAPVSIETNSLFNSLSTPEEEPTSVTVGGKSLNTYVAHIANGRQLQNLHDRYSSFTNKVGPFRLVGITFDEDVVWDDVDGLSDVQGDTSFWNGARNCIQRQLDTYASQEFINGFDSTFGNWTKDYNTWYQLNKINANKTFRPLYELWEDTSLTGVTGFTIDGDGHRILNLRMEEGADKCWGLFTRSRPELDVTFKDLYMVNPWTIEGTNDGGAGSLIGELGENKDTAATGQVTIANCGAYMSSADEYIKGSLNLTPIGTDGKPAPAKNDPNGRRIYSYRGAAGGLVGRCFTALTITDSFAAVPVMGGELGSDNKCAAGGLLGWMQNNNTKGRTGRKLTIRNCHTGGYLEKVTTGGEKYIYSPEIVGIATFSTRTGNSEVGSGGLIGILDLKTNLLIENSYSSSSVASTNEAGGFIGHSSVVDGGMTIRNCYCVGTVYCPTKESGIANTEQRSGIFCAADTEYANQLRSTYINCYAFGLTNKDFAKTPDWLEHPKTSLGERVEKKLDSNLFVPYDDNSVTTDDLIEDHEQNNGDTTIGTYSYAIDGLSYPYRSVTEANGKTAAGLGRSSDGNFAEGSLVHVGDWPTYDMDADATVRITNEDTLTANISFPIEDAATGARINLLVLGEKSGKGAYARFYVIPNESSASGYDLQMVMPGKTYDSNITLLGTTEDARNAFISATQAQITNKGSSLEIELVLDDVTRSGAHFANIFAGTGLEPGEPIKVIVEGGEISVAKLKGYVGLNAIEDAEKVTRTNGLFSDASDFSTARIAYARHLQNLDPKISGVNGTAASPAGVTSAELTRDITWSSDTYPAVFALDSALSSTDSFYGIYNAKLTSMDGKNHRISSLVVKSAPSFDVANGTNNAGLFRLVDNGMELKNVKLDGIDVHSTSGHAGAAVAEVTGTGATLNTVLAIASSTKVIQATGDSYAAGGLVGSIDVNLGQSVAIKNSAATILVSAQGAAGGLIGQQLVGQVTVEQSYAGGHTVGAAYSHTSYNVTSSSAAAGGIIGHVAGGSLSATYSFTAASVSGTAAAGGVLGKVDVPVSLQMAYVIAPVDGITSSEADGKHGAFAGIIAEDVTVTNTQTYYLPEIYSGLVQGEITSESIPLVGGELGTLSDGVNLGYYGDSANDISARTHQDTMQIKTYPYDATLMGTSNTGEREYPFSIWTEFEFDNRIRNRVEGKTYGVYYGDWQPVLTPATVLHEALFKYEDPLSGEVNDAPDENLATQQLREGRVNRLLVPSVPYVPGYTVGYWEVANTEGETGDPLQLTEENGYVIIPIVKANADRTITAHYVPTGEKRVSFFYDKTGANQNFEQIGQTQALAEGKTMRDVVVPSRNVAGYRFVGWYADEAFELPLNFDSDDPITDHINAFAKYQKIEYYTITIDFMYETDQGDTGHLASVPRYRVDDTAQYRIQQVVGTTFDEVIDLPTVGVGFTLESAFAYEDSVDSGSIELDKDAGTIHVVATTNARFMVLYHGSPSGFKHYTVRYRFHDTNPSSNTPNNWNYKSDAVPNTWTYSADNVFTYNPYQGHDTGANFTAPLQSSPDIEKVSYEGFTEPLVHEIAISENEANNVIYVDYYRKSYVLTYDTRSGSPLDPVQLVYGQPISAAKPTANNTTKRKGYAIDTSKGSEGWDIFDDVSTSGEGTTNTYTWNSNMPANNVKAQVNWKEGTSSYVIIVWKQNINDAKDAGQPGSIQQQKTYDYESSTDPISWTTGLVPSTTVSRKNYESLTFDGFEYSHTDIKSEVINPDGSVTNTNTVLANGTTVVNVYYDRVLMTMNFMLWGTTYSPTSSNNNATYYGLIDGEYIRLERTSTGYSSYAYYYYASVDTPNTNTRYYGVVNWQYVEVYYDSTYGWVYDWWGNTYLYTGSEFYTRVQYTGQRYTAGNGWGSYKTMTGLYGQTLAQSGYTWPAEYDWYTTGTNNGGVGGTHTTFLDIFNQKKRVTSFYSNGSEGGSYTISHYKQNVDGTYPAVATNSTKTGGSGTWNFTEKYTGFTCSWYTDANHPTMTSARAGGSTSYSGNLNVYYERNSYDLDIRTSDGTLIDHRLVLFEQNLNTLRIDDPEPSAELAAEEYAWDGQWYADKGCTETFNWNVGMPASSVAVYVKFVPPSYMVTFDILENKPADSPEATFVAGSGTSHTHTVLRNNTLDSIIADAAGNLKDEYTPQMEGYTFTGWYYNDNGTEKQFYTATPIQQDMTVYPKWSKNGEVQKANVKVYYRDRDGNNIKDQDGADIPYDVFGPYEVGTIVSIPAKNIEGYYPTLTAMNVLVQADDESEATFTYIPITPWHYKVEYYAHYSSLESGGEALGATNVEAPGVAFDYLLSSVSGIDAYSQYETIAYATPEGFDNYHLDHYEYAGTTGTGTIVTIHPGEADTDGDQAVVRYYLVPDTTTLHMNDRFATYDGTSKAIAEEPVGSDVYTPPANAQTEVINCYRYFDASGNTLLSNDQVIDAGSYKMNGYVVLSVTGTAMGDSEPITRKFLLWKDVGNHRLIVGRRAITLKSKSGFTSYDPEATLDSGNELTSIEVEGTFAEGQGLDCHFTVEAFRKDRGTSDNSFTYTFWTNTNPDNYDVTTLFGALTVVVKTNYTESNDTSCGEGIYYVVDGDVNNPDEGLSLVFDKRSDDVTTPIEMPNFTSADQVPWTQYDREQLGEITSINLNGCYSTIGDNAFAGLTGLASIDVPEGVTVIGGSAFAGDTALAAVTLPNGLLSIGPSAFAGNTSLEEIEIPSSVTAIGDSAFAGDSALTTATLPNIEIISANTFANTGLTSIDIPASVTEIGTSAFEGNTSLTTVTGLAGVTTIDASAFAGDKALTSIALPNTLTSVGAGAFVNSGIETLYKADGETEYTKEADEAALAALCPELAEESNTDENRIKAVFAGTPLVAAWYPEEPQNSDDNTNTDGNTNGNTNQNSDTNGDGNGQNNGQANDQNDGQAGGQSTDEPIATTQGVDQAIEPFDESLLIEPLTVINDIVTSIEEEAESQLTEEELKTQELEAAFADVLTDTDAVVTKSELGDYLYYALVHNDDDVVIRDENDEEVERVKGYTLMLVAREPHEGEEPESMKYRVPDYDDPQGTFDETYEPKRVPWASYSGTGSDSHEYNEYDFRPYITRVVLDDRITDVGDYAFSDLTALSTITLPRDVERIGKGAFANGGAHGLTEAWPYKPKDMTPEQEEEYKAYTTPQLADLSRADLIDPDETDETKLAEQRESALALTDEEALGRAFADTPLFKAAYPTA